MNSQQQRQRANEIKAMLASQGWQYVQEDLETSERQLTDDLIAEIDQTKITSLQADLRAIRLLFRKLEAWSQINT